MTHRFPKDARATTRFPSVPGRTAILLTAALTLPSLATPPIAVHRTPVGPLEPSLTWYVRQHTESLAAGCTAEAAVWVEACQRDFPEHPITELLASHHELSVEAAATAGRTAPAPRKAIVRPVVLIVPHEAQKREPPKLARIEPPQPVTPARTTRTGVPPKTAKQTCVAPCPVANTCSACEDCAACETCPFSTAPSWPPRQQACGPTLASRLRAIASKSRGDSPTPVCGPFGCPTEGHALPPAEPTEPELQVTVELVGISEPLLRRMGVPTPIASGTAGRAIRLSVAQASRLLEGRMTERDVRPLAGTTHSGNEVSVGPFGFAYRSGRTSAPRFEATIGCKTGATGDIRLHAEGDGAGIGLPFDVAAVVESGDTLLIDLGEEIPPTPSKRLQFRDGRVVRPQATAYHHFLIIEPTYPLEAAPSPLVPLARQRQGVLGR